MGLIKLAERDYLSDWMIRIGIRRLLSRRCKQVTAFGENDRSRLEKVFADQLRKEPLVVNAVEANQQHYEVPADFFRLVLGPRLKYSSSLWPEGGLSLKEAEDKMLQLTCQRALIEDGMQILELGCGWGSLALWVAEHFPASQITAVSNSHGQREYIEQQAKSRELANIEVIVSDISDFETKLTFDRVVSVEMFEHLRNYEFLMNRIAGWLKPGGKLFVHIFCHQSSPYFFETSGAANWMGRHFFTGGMMPSADLLLHFQEVLDLEDRWKVNGLHYSNTCEAWLKNLDLNRSSIDPLFVSAAGNVEAGLVVQRWRMFFMACAELFRFRGGNEWFVSHYRFQRSQDRTHPRIQGAL